MCSLHQVLACSCNGVCDSGPDYNSIPRSKTAFQNTFSSKLMCYKLRSHTATQSLGIMSEIMLSPLPALINHQTPPGLCMSFVQCKDPKDYLQQRYATIFMKLPFFCFFKKKSYFFHTPFWIMPQSHFPYQSRAFVSTWLPNSDGDSGNRR